MTGRTKAEVNRKNSRARLPTEFKPRFWDGVDGRLLITKQIKGLVSQLEEDANCQSIQMKILAQRAAFITVQLQTAEINAVEGGKIDLGQYVQGCNALSGILSKLGLKKHAKKVGDLETYIAGENGEDGEWE